jgi:pimeloyl-ACP methyl ester carboxylesterase
MLDLATLTLFVSPDAGRIAEACRPWENLLAMRPVPIPNELADGAGWLLVRPDGYLVLVNTGGFTPHSAFTRWPAPSWKAHRVEDGVPGVCPRLHAGEEEPHKAVVARVAARVKTAEGARTAAVLWKSFTEPGHDLRARAAQMTAPVLITWGAEDLTAPKRWGKAVQAAIPGSRFEALPTGHVVFSSEPEAWLDTVLPFVDAAHGVRPGLQRHS